jgi:serine/threonine-protein kinase
MVIAGTPVKGERYVANDDPEPLDPPPPPRAADPAIGSVINSNFRLISLIGRGGMGKIYKAEQLSLHRMVAIKLLNIADKTTNIEEFRERFYREASLCARLSHPNIVTIHDYGMVDGSGDET